MAVSSRGLGVLPEKRLSEGYRRGESLVSVPLLHSGTLFPHGWSDADSPSSHKYTTPSFIMRLPPGISSFV